MNARLSIKPSRKKLIGLCLIVAPVFLTTGCASLTTPSKPPIPASMTSPCPNLTPLDNGESDTVLRKIVEISEAYYQCSDKHNSLVEVVK